MKITDKAMKKRYIRYKKEETVNETAIQTLRKAGMVSSTRAMFQSLFYWIPHSNPS